MGRAVLSLFSARTLHDKISRNLLGGGLTTSPGLPFKDTCVLWVDCDKRR